MASQHYRYAHHPETNFCRWVLKEMGSGEIWRGEYFSGESGPWLGALGKWMLIIVIATIY